MPGGTVLAAMFFLAMAFAALTSMISTFEGGVRNFMDHGWSRPKVIKFIAIAMFLCGLPSAVVVLSVGGAPTPVFLDNQDAVWGLALIVSGLFVAFAVWNYGVERFREELINTKYSDIYIGKWWEYVIKILFPIQFLILISWYIVDMLGREPLTVLTLVVQWGAALAILIYLNDWINSKPLVPRPKMDDEDDEEVVEGEVVEVEPVGG
jgi:NSS family neurotransmitter:Na+ symporter